MFWKPILSYLHICVLSHIGHCFLYVYVWFVCVLFCLCILQCTYRKPQLKYTPNTEAVPSVLGPHPGGMFSRGGAHRFKQQPPEALLIHSGLLPRVTWLRSPLMASSQLHPEY